MKPIAEMRAEYERAHGLAVRSYMAYPVVGRGMAAHDWISHDEADRRYCAARSIPILKKICWLMGGRLWI